MNLNKNGPILIIEDDLDDQAFIQATYTKLGYTNELVFLEDGEVAIEYIMGMKKTPFLIISDLNMPKMNGIELRAKVRANDAINIRCTPYIILSSSATRSFVDDTYTLGIQGYFKKPSTQQEFEEIFKNIISYWKISYSPGMYH